MSAEEIQLDRYNKFRGLGLWEEFLVAGGRNKEAREALEKGEPASKRFLAPRRAALCGACLGGWHRQCAAGATAPPPGQSSATSSTCGAGSSVRQPGRQALAPCCRAAAEAPRLPSLLPRAPAAPGAFTAAGTWAPTADDAKFLELCADMEDKWQQVGF